jgi:hypothetical protein
VAGKERAVTLAEVIPHPALIDHLLTEKQAEIEIYRQWFHDLGGNGDAPVKVAEEWDPRMTYYGAQEDAIEGARLAVQWAERELAELEARLPCPDCHAPPGQPCGERRCPRLAHTMGETQ